MKNKNMHSHNFVDRTGETFGRLTVIRFFDVIKTPSGQPKLRWMCECLCGNRVVVRAMNLSYGFTKSCGCLKKENGKLIGSKLLRLKHGCSAGKRTREYKIWCGAKSRCFNLKNKDFKNYGGRGITMCEAWKRSFDRFLLDMGTCPENMSLERKNTNGNYEPGNCKWASARQQSNNKRTNRLIGFLGDTKTLAQWSRATGKSIQLLYWRLKRGWSVGDAITLPVRGEK